MAGDGSRTEVADDWPLGPVEIDLTEAGAFGGFDGRGVLRLEGRVNAGVADDLAGAGVDFRGLPGGFGFEQGVPTPGVDGVRLEGDAADGGWRDLGCFDEVAGGGV